MVSLLHRTEVQVRSSVNNKNTMQYLQLSHSYIAQNFDGRKLWQIAAQEHFGRKNFGGLAAVHSKSARIIIVGE